jgi:hypothetical protein
VFVAWSLTTRSGENDEGKAKKDDDEARWSPRSNWAH